MAVPRVKTRLSKKRSGSDLDARAVPICSTESELFKERLRELIGERKNVWFARECGFSDSLLGAYLRGEKLPGFEKLVAIANVDGVTIDWLTTGRPPKTRAELSLLTSHPASAYTDLAYRAAVEAIQEWQIEQGRLLPLDKFESAIDLLIKLADGEAAQIKPNAATVLGLTT
ncbi:helix-turn-helix domain-containing protein [Rhodocyclus gracilis]|uniref:Helix-turn-helix domain-containing protein n=1 Tax=Rhodocyclus tenuis TaxID=1066 RepID=A0A6L5JYZ6_RHOTE|nr:helix-turn-helix transcriptional regulator [Rhodocyclus gracilis]MQY52537.1 helix-turn-helix domain-containing protein [Rhodocyclus gracilis]